MTYRYAVLFPLALFEGPLVSLAVGFMVSLGYFNFLLAYAILLLGDLIPDTLYYAIGRFGNKRELIERHGRSMPLLSRHFPLLEKLWHEHGRKTMFLSKLAYGLSTPLLISAGLVNLSFKKFFSYAFPITLFQYAIIMAIGYFLGYSYERAVNYITDVGLLLAVVILLGAGYVFVRRYARRQIENIQKEKP